MIRKLVIFLMVLLTLSPLFSREDDGMSSLSFGFEDLLVSPLYSPSYSGRFIDSILNPANLSKRSDSGIFYFTTTFSDLLSRDVFSSGEKLPYIQNFKSEMTFSFISKYFSATILTNTYFRNREMRGDYLESDIFNTLMLQLDASYSFPYVSIGVRIKGGNRLIREDRRLDDFFQAVGNAYFSPFEVMPHSEFFSLGGYLSFEYSFFSASFAIEDIVTLRFPDNMSSPSIYVGSDAVLDSMEISFALTYPKFNSRGELNFLRPRASYTIYGNPAGAYEMYIVGALEFQLLPTMSLSVAAGYMEYDHSFFRFNEDRGTMMFAIEFLDRFYSLRLGFNVDTSSFSRFAPSFSFSLLR